MTTRLDRMTMISFRVDASMASRLDAVCESKGVARSDFLRDALRREINRIASEAEAEWIGDEDPDAESARAFAAIESWSPQEDWSDWIAWLDERDGAAARKGAVGQTDVEEHVDAAR